MSTASTPARAQAPIRWPKLRAVELTLVGVWVAGVLVALLLPAALVPPQAETAPARDVVMALVVTVIGALMMIVSSYVLFLRTKEIGAFVLGGVPAFTCICGGIILAAAKLTGTGTGVG